MVDRAIANSGSLKGSLLTPRPRASFCHNREPRLNGSRRRRNVFCTSR